MCGQSDTMTVKLKLVSQCDEGLDIASAADNLDDDVESKIKSIDFGAIYWQLRFLPLVREGDQLCNCSADLGVKIDFNASIV